MAEFDPDVWGTWPIPKDFIFTHRGDMPHRLSEAGYAWVDGFEAGWNKAREEELERLTNRDVL